MASGQSSSVGGGEANTVLQSYGTVAGGQFNSVYGSGETLGFIGGGCVS